MSSGDSGSKLYSGKAVASIIAGLLLVITGHPKLIASNGGKPKPSFLDGYINAVEFK